MKHKKIILLILSSFLFVFTLTACEAIAQLLHNTADKLEQPDVAERGTELAQQVQTLVAQAQEETHQAITPQEPTANSVVSFPLVQSEEQATPAPDDNAASLYPAPESSPSPSEAPPATRSTGSREVRFMGLSFSIPDALQEENNLRYYAEEIKEIEAEKETGAFLPHPAHIQFNLALAEGRSHMHQAQVLVFPMYGIIEYYEWWQNEYILLNLIGDEGDFSIAGDEPLPFLPIFPAMQVFYSHEKALTFQNGRGIRYLTMYTQGNVPADSFNLFYTFQGVTEDNNYYVVGIMPIYESPLPEHAGEPPASDNFHTDPERYLQDVIDLLNNTPSGDFLPNLELLDLIFESLNLHVQ